MQRPPRVTSVRPTRTVEPEDTRGRLLAAARDVFLEDGPVNFSLREVARRVNVSAPAVYRHFDGKDALLAAACHQGFEVFSSYLVRALGAPSARERLLETGEQYRRFGQENPLDYRFIFMSDTRTLSDKIDTSKRDVSVLALDSTFRFLVDRVRECMDAKILLAGSAESTAALIWAHVHGLVALRLAGHLDPVGDEDSFATFYRQSVESLLRGLAP